jgi:hypothetical protein
MGNRLRMMEGAMVMVRVEKAMDEKGMEALLHT